MPVVTINGDKKKVACGPCIRGHRSSKCVHKDRVLIEVRKPGRPLGACPHPPGSCGCERAIINYTVPRERTDPAKVVKPKAVRSQFSLSQSTVQKVIEGDPETLAALANIQNGDTNPYSDQSSKTPSSASSSSSTPSLEAIDNGSNLRNRQIRLPYIQPNTPSWIEPSPRPATAQSFTSNGSDLQTSNSCCCGGSSAASQPDTPTTFTNTPKSEPTTDPSPHFRDWALYQNGIQDHGYSPSTFNTDFGSYELTVGCSGMHPPSLTPGMSTETTCGCGDGCTCFACTTHPNNRTTVDYVRYHNDLFLRSQFDLHTQDQHFDINALQHQHQPQALYIQQMKSAYPIDQQQQSSTSSMQSHNENPQARFDAAQQMMTPMPIYSIPRSSISHTQPFAPVEESRQIAQHIHQGWAENRNETPSFLSAALVESSVEANESEDEASTLSPSSFLLQHFTVGDCSDVTGTCRCGEGCQCTGCLTHSGHQALEIKA